MTTDSLIASRDRPITLRARCDLVFQRHTHQGEPWWVVKDPLSLQYFRIREEQYAALRMLDGRTTLSEVKTALERQFPHKTIRLGDLQSLLAMLHRSGLVVADAPGQAEVLIERRQTRERQKWMMRLFSVLWIRLPGVDPERFLSWLNRWFGWIYQPWCLLLCSALILSALLLITVHFNEFYERLPSFRNFCSPQNAGLILVALAFSKILHEIGHGLTCKYFGGECHQIGIMFLVFTPCLYCDTSDAWLLPNKWKRAAIGAAGMYFELVLAAVCTFIWWRTHPGVLHYLCLNIMFTCSISTLIFNSNPLLRYDGYYIFSDLLETPNLAQRSRSCLIGFLRQLCLGLPWRSDHVAPPRHRTLFALYAVASLAYRWFVLVVILWVLSMVFEPYGLKSVGRVLVVLAILGAVVGPLFGAVKFFRVPGRWRQVNRYRAALTAIVAAAVVAAVFLVPFPRHVITTFVIEPADAQNVFIQSPGLLQDISATPGQEVAAGAPLAVLSNPELLLELTRLEGRLERLRQQLDSLQRSRGADSSVAEAIPTVTESMLSTEQRIAQLKKDVDRLQLKADRAGFVIPPPENRRQRTSQGELAYWSGTPLDEENLGAHLRSGELFCMIGDPTQMQALIYIDQSEIDFVQQGDAVRLMFDEYPAETWQSTIVEIATLDLKVAPRELSQRAGGAMATERDSSGDERPMSVSFEGLAKIANPEGRISPGFRGQAKIHVGYSSLGQRLLRYLAESFNFKR